MQWVNRKTINACANLAYGSFTTERSRLEIHQYPHFSKKQALNGMQGCIWISLYESMP